MDTSRTSMAQRRTFMTQLDNSKNTDRPYWLSTHEEHKNSDGNCDDKRCLLYKRPRTKNTDKKDLYNCLEDRFLRFVGGVDSLFGEDIHDLFFRTEKELTKYIEQEKLKVAQNAMAIALYWIEEDGRPKHLIQDMWDVVDISVLDHIDPKYIEEAKGHYGR